MSVKKKIMLTKSVVCRCYRNVGMHIAARRAHVGTIPIRKPICGKNGKISNYEIIG